MAAEFDIKVPIGNILRSFSTMGLVYSMMAFNRSDWKNLIVLPVILSVTAAFQFHRHHPETAFFFAGIALIMFIILFIRLRKK